MIYGAAGHTLIRMSEHKHTNALARETSPYLLQHAHNPVEWYPWSEEALRKARREDKPILLSVGYSACHWCHVMERESFENEGIAALMNDLFVNIKVDREERPDLDAIFHASGSGHDRQGRLADDRLPDTGSGAVLRRHVLPSGGPAWNARVSASAPQCGSGISRQEG